MSHSLHLWNLLGNLHDRCAESMTLPCVVPKPCVSALLLSGEVSLRARPRYISFEAKEARHLLLRKSIVDDGRSKAFASLRELQIGPFRFNLFGMVTLPRLSFSAHVASEYLRGSFPWVLDVAPLFR